MEIQSTADAGVSDKREHWTGGELRRDPAGRAGSKDWSGWLAFVLAGRRRCSAVAARGRPAAKGRTSQWYDSGGKRGEGSDCGQEVPNSREPRCGDASVEMLSSFLGGDRLLSPRNAFCRVLETRPVDVQQIEEDDAKTRIMEQDQMSKRRESQKRRMSGIQLIVYLQPASYLKKLTQWAHFLKRTGRPRPTRTHDRLLSV